MDIGTAKVDAAERALVRHHGLDLVDPDETFSVADYRRHALDALHGIASRGRPAILVGGTGLYLRAVARGLPVEASGHDPAIRAELEQRLAERGSAPWWRSCRHAPHPWQGASTSRTRDASCARSNG